MSKDCSISSDCWLNSSVRNSSNKINSLSASTLTLQPALPGYPIQRSCKIQINRRPHPQHCFKIFFIVGLRVSSSSRKCCTREIESQFMAAMSHIHSARSSAYLPNFSSMWRRSTYTREDTLARRMDRRKREFAWRRGESYVLLFEHVISSSVLSVSKDDSKEISKILNNEQFLIKN